MLVPCGEDSALEKVSERPDVLVDISDALVVDNGTSWFCDWEFALGVGPTARAAIAASAVAANTPTVLSTTDAGIRDTSVADAGGLTRAFSGWSMSLPAANSSKGRMSSSCGWSWERDGSSSHMRPILRRPVSCASPCV